MSLQSKGFSGNFSLITQGQCVRSGWIPGEFTNQYHGASELRVDFSSTYNSSELETLMQVLRKEIQEHPTNFRKFFQNGLNNQVVFTFTTNINTHMGNDDPFVEMTSYIRDLETSRRTLASHFVKTLASGESDYFIKFLENNPELLKLVNEIHADFASYYEKPDTEHLLVSKVSLTRYRITFKRDGSSIDWVLNPIEPTDKKLTAKFYENYLAKE